MQRLQQRQKLCKIIKFFNITSNLKKLNINRHPPNSEPTTVMQTTSVQGKPAESNKQR
jgi:hypothetical protein